MGDHSEDYEQGLRDGRLKSLERAVASISEDLDKLKRALWLLYGALGLVGVLPEILEMIGYGR